MFIIGKVSIKRHIEHVSYKMEFGVYPTRKMNVLTLQDKILKLLA